MGTAGRSMSKAQLIRQWLRREIIDGRFAAGDLLPTRRALRERFGTGPGTVQQALSRLVREGFVEAHARKGTFVAAHPPHRCRYGVVSGFQAGQRGREEGLWRVVIDETQAMARPDRRFAYYFGIDGHADAEDMGRLIGDLQARRLAGLIFLHPPADAVRQTPIVQMPGVPRVMIASDPREGIPAVWMDDRNFYERAVRWLTERGCTRIAMLATAGPGTRPPSAQERLAAAVLKARGLPVRPYWFQHVPAMGRHQMRRIVHLMMQADQRAWPDGLIIDDDVIAEPATLGLHDAGVRVPDDVAVVGRCNFPARPPAVVPVQWLGCSATAILEQCLDLLAAQQSGAAPAATRVVPAMFEDE